MTHRVENPFPQRPVCKATQVLSDRRDKRSQKGRGKYQRG